MRIVLFVAVVLCLNSRAADLPLYFNSGSDFVGTITKNAGSISRVGENVTLRMVTVANKAIVIAVQKVGTEYEFASLFQIKNDNNIFTSGKSVLDEKARQINNGNRRVLELRNYTNNDYIVAARLWTDPHPRMIPQTHIETIILHPVDKDTVQGEILVLDYNKNIIDNIFFDVKRAGSDTATPPAPAPGVEF